jgi:hypothetical protein
MAGENYLHNIGLFDGNSWIDMGNGTGTNMPVLAVTVDGPDVYFGGYFTRVNMIRDVGRIARWKDFQFYSLDNSNNGMNEVVTSLAAVGDYVVAGGFFGYTGCAWNPYIAMWDGHEWLPLGSGMNGVVCAVTSDPSYIYAGGNFTHAGGEFAEDIARWNGNQWLPVGPGIKNGLVFALATNGTDLYAGGDFTMAGFTPVNNIAHWDGSGWYELGSGTDGPVYAAAVIGTDAYAGGDFTTAGGVTVNNIAKWDGSSWSPLICGTDGPVYAMTTDGTDLYVGGDFSYAGFYLAYNVAKWDGSEWWALGHGATGRGVHGPVRAIAVCNGDVYVGGDFTVAGYDTAYSVAVFTGGDWYPLGSGIGGEKNMYRTDGVWAIACAAGGDVYVGGNFSSAGGKGSHGIACWHTVLPTDAEMDPVPVRHMLSQNFPNPFNPYTTIRYEVPAAGGKVSIGIYDVSGRLVRVLIDAPHTGGSYEVSWSGLDDGGRRVASGIYFCRLKAAGHVETTKIVLVK